MYCGDVHYVHFESELEDGPRKVTPVLVSLSLFLPHYLLGEERGGMKDVSSGPEAISFLSLSLFFFLREECDRFRDEDRSGGIVENEIETNFISGIFWRY